MKFLEYFHGLCVLIAIVLTGYSLYQYILNLDVSSITLRKFHEFPDDVHPSITICDKDPFDFGRLLTERKEDDPGLLLLDKYFLLIRGMGYNYSHETTQQLQETDYDNVSARLNDILTAFSIDIFTTFDHLVSLDYNVNGYSLKINEDIEDLTKEIALPDSKLFENIQVHVSERSGRYKCFTFDIPMLKGITVQKVKIKMNSTWASSGIGRINLRRYNIKLTYPNQTLQVPRGKMIFLDQHHRFGLNCYQFSVFLGTMEVFQRRDKSKKRCNQDWQRQDQQLMRHVIEKAGCNPKHWKIQSELPYCYSAKQYRSIDEIYLNSQHTYMPPCRSIELFSKTTKGRDPGWICPKEKGYLDLLFYMDEEMYKEISLVPAFNFQSLVGNAGNIASIFFLF